MPQNDLALYREMVAEFYKENSDVFSKPDRATCLLYALTEFGEAIDAYIRKVNHGHLRRAEKETDYETEVGDMKLMLMAATLGCGERGELEYKQGWAFSHGVRVWAENTPLLITRIISRAHTVLGRLQNESFRNEVSGATEALLIEMLEQFHWKPFSHRSDEIFLSVSKLTKRIAEKRNK